ncbi:probable tRNA (guanine(26)-N(2))-dimethyltransferase 2 isoform X2 [Phoenix dactylifera]|uniref:tRNA (guanine(26)-N(2))-dimethyltransferase n=1 Tax=Phoenix dactylifera TaxID=42345 RepID=A0A8B9B1E6_PHODC|nr:probable tRNA (guanine(26)-N(2))-dimethyltransferase 2 isoform X2 [Phoenix dactylifera]
MRFLIGTALRLRRIPSKWNLSFCSSASCRRFHHLEQSQSEFDMGDAGEKFEEYTIVQEGEAEILLHSGNRVFYNKTQVNNRDMSIAILRTFISKCKEEHATKFSRKAHLASKMPEGTPPGPISEESNIVQDEEPQEDCEMKLNQSLYEMETILRESHKTIASKEKEELKAPKVLEALAASGLRSIRYAREIDELGQIVALDCDKVCIEACKRNVQFNGSVASSKVEAHLADARVYMLTHPKEFDVVDLDPYGSPSVFLDSAIQTVVDGGLLMCTATDLAVLCGGNAAVCYSKYGSYPLKGKYCHEMALRILLACIETHANRHKRYIVPILSVHMDFYIRVFVRIFTSANEVKNTPLRLSYVYQCIGCDSFHLQSLGRTSIKNNSVKHAPGFGPVVPQECSNCGKKFNMGGPIWSAPIHDQEWVASMLANVKAMKDRYPAYEKISAVLTTVLEELPDVPLFVSLHNLCTTLKCTPPPAAMLRSAVINAGYRISGSHVNPLALKTDAPMDVIWDIMRCWANFAQAVTASWKTQAEKVRRFVPNPERNWGPKIRGGRQIKSKHASTLGQMSVNGLVSHERRNGPQLVALETDERHEHIGHKGDEPDSKRERDL